MVASRTLQATLPPFYSTAAPLLVAFLITWLVAEARSLRVELRANPNGTKRQVFLVPVALGLTIGAFVALRVEYVDRAGSADQTIIWAALALGFAGATISVALSVLLTADGLASPGSLLNGLRLAKRWVPVAAAVVVGLIASPLVRVKTVAIGTKFVVYGTCITGKCGLKQRSGAGAGFPQIPSHQLISDGTLVLVVCQIMGTPPLGYANRVWDRLASGAYVTDVFVNTPNRKGGFSQGIPRCGATRPTGSVG